jgi:hypothetical protein
MSKAKVGMVKLMEELDRLSIQISTQTRTVALSTIAMAWALLIGKEKAAFDRTYLLLCGGFALASLFVDYMQYASGYIYTDQLRTECETTKKDVDYDCVFRSSRSAFRSMAIASPGMPITIGA